MDNWLISHWNLQILQLLQNSGLTESGETKQNERMLEVIESVRYLGLSGEGFGLRGGGVRGTAGLGAMEAAGTKP